MKSHVNDSGGATPPNNRGDPNGLAAYLNRAEWLRLPRSGDRDPICGLSRSTINELVLPCDANNFRPPVKSIVLKKRGATRGIRLVSAESLSLYLESLIGGTIADSSGNVEVDHD